MKAKQTELVGRSSEFALEIWYRHLLNAQYCVLVFACKFVTHKKLQTCLKGMYSDKLEAMNSLVSYLYVHVCNLLAYNYTAYPFTCLTMHST